jgi:hypothetical protein
MDQKQDELQAAIDNITNASAAVADSTSNDVVSQIENKVADAEPEIASAQSAEPAGDKAIKEAEASKIEMTPQKAMYGDPDLDRVKINALNEIRPILETVDILPEKKFTIYKDIIELTDDKACIEPAYNAARQIADEKERAEALLYIIEIIDDLGVKMPAEDKK